MHPVIRFHSRLFGISLVEAPNPINPIHGSSILEWLRTKLPEGASMTEIAAEDWGWYCDVRWNGCPYMVGSSVEESSDGNHEWLVQIHKHRTFRDKLLGRNKLTSSDPCLAFLLDTFRREPAFTEVTIELGP